MSQDDVAMRRRRALYRATRRGSKELDFLLGRFAENNIETMSVSDIGVLEQLIDLPDRAIAASLFEGNLLGEPALDALMRRLRRFHGVVPGRIKSC